MIQKSLTIGSTRATFNVTGRNGGVSTTIRTSRGFWTNQRRLFGTTASMMIRLAAKTARMHQSLAAPRTCHALPRSDSCTMMVGMASSAATISGVRIHRAVRSAREAACVLLEVSSCVPFPLPVDISQTPPVFPRFVGAARAAPFVLRLPRPDLRCPTQDTEEQRGCEEHEDR